MIRYRRTPAEPSHDRRIAHGNAAKAPDPFVSVHLRFANAGEKMLYMRSRLVEDMRDPGVIQWAAWFRKRFSDKRELTAALLRFVQLCIDYQQDPGIEVLDSPGAALVRSYGDCDVKARTFRALCELCGIACELAAVFRPDGRFPHVKNAVNLEDGRPQSQWLPVDPTNLNSTLTDYALDRPKTNHW